MTASKASISPLSPTRPYTARVAVLVSPKSRPKTAATKRMLALLDEGLSAAEAARFAAGDEAGERERAAEPTPFPDGAAGGPERLGSSAAELNSRLEAFDDGAAQVLLDDLLARYSLEAVLSAVILPCLAEIGRRWESGDLSVAQEHFASNSPGSSTAGSPPRSKARDVLRLTGSAGPLPHSAGPQLRRSGADLSVMRIDGSHRVPLPASNPAGRAHGAPDTTPAFEAAPAPAPAPAEGDSPADGKAHGLVRAAEHSNRSDVAALRQWINHPELRGDLALPDLAAEHNGNGFQKAVAAYEAASAIGTPPATEPPDSTAAGDA